ncbi:DUF2628 domain-containing protein [Uliginosibacterium paludis]|uniref:DUF2628 domain-containing protein n=1 Tax=Uliginosibacterium paludis TaxID=1615952 RepID=A0ABV2CNA3_9RHOO
MSEALSCMPAPSRALADAQPVRPLDAADRARAQFVGSSFPAYQARWEALRSKGFSWNWAAFCFGPGWLAYRKMPVPCAALLGFVMFETSLEQIASVPASITAAIYLLMAIGFGVSGDRLYRYHVDSSVRLITGSGSAPAAVDAELIHKGGTSLCHAMGFVMLLVAVLVAIVVVLAEPAALP